MNQQYSSGQEPWYAPTQKKKQAPLISLSEKRITNIVSQGNSVRSFLTTLANGWLSLLCAVGSGLVFLLSIGPDPQAPFPVAVMASIGLLFLSGLFMLRLVGAVAGRLSSKHGTDSPLRLALSVTRGEVKGEEARKGIPAPEMALYQFVQQVRAYATEKNFQKTKQTDKPGQDSASTPLMMEPVDLLKRRWNEVIDSLNEFEIYLANDPQGMISKLVAKHPVQLIDVSQVFREVAESFDNTWRRKGINIESAIVTPLRATTNEALLRRLLVGPWRASAYFARRGNGVLFSAKSVEGQVVARWECEGLMMPEEYLKIAMDSTLSVNERIEKGLAMVAPDPNSPNTLHALISFLAWIDLAKACSADFAFKHTNDGFAIELRLK